MNNDLEKARLELIEAMMEAIHPNGWNNTRDLLFAALQAYELAILRAAGVAVREYGE